MKAWRQGRRSEEEEEVRGEEERRGEEWR